jgi:peptide chain release factor subunit 1
MADSGETDKNIEIWKIKKLIKALESARGNGTSMISLIMPPRYESAPVRVNLEVLLGLFLRTCMLYV